MEDLKMGKTIVSDRLLEEIVCPTWIRWFGYQS